MKQNTSTPWHQEADARMRALGREREWESEGGNKDRRSLAMAEGTIKRIKRIKLKVSLKKKKKTSAEVLILGVSTREQDGWDGEQIWKN